jgi:hypothetical protein
MPVTSGSVERFVPLQRAAITLPDSARVVKQVEVTYQNLDGSIAKTQIDLDHSIDWHLPLFVSQSYSATRPESPAPAEPKPEPTKAAPVKSSFSKVIDFGELAFWQSGKALKIVTKDPLVRHFMLVEPHRIVLDFKRDANFRSKQHTIKGGNPYKNIRLGNHRGYYRAVIELDGQYRYTTDRRDEALFLRCY